MAVPLTSDTFRFTLDRQTGVSLADQIRNGIARAIDSGVLRPGARLPSWIDLASQLGVARGTVKAAYEKLLDAQLVTASRATGTRVAEQRRSAPMDVTRQAARVDTRAPPPAGAVTRLYEAFSAGPGIFQMGVPAPDAVPTRLFRSVRTHAARSDFLVAAQYPDPAGDLPLRREIAAYLALARGIACAPAQVFITAGFASGLNFCLRVLGQSGKDAWVEDPGFPFARRGLELAGLTPVPVPVDADGVDVAQGLVRAPEACLALITPGQQAPLGSTLSLTRRLQLLDWAEQRQSWIVEDDYLSELQLDGRAAPALAALDGGGRVIHIGSFSKTIGPSLRLGFVVMPLTLAAQATEVAVCLQPSPSLSVQSAMTDFMMEGHYLRHLRRAKRIYLNNRRELVQQLAVALPEHTRHAAGLSVLLGLSDEADDTRIAGEALRFGLAPFPMSSWYVDPAGKRRGLLLGLSTSTPALLPDACQRLGALIALFGDKVEGFAE